MENQGNMQSGKKAAVIYFLAAFFIACIGIAGANYLKGELGLSAEELVKKVELTVEIAVLLFFFLLRDFFHGRILESGRKAS